MTLYCVVYIKNRVVTVEIQYSRMLNRMATRQRLIWWYYNASYELRSPHDIVFGFH